VTPHRATPEQWVNLERRQLGGNDLVCAALELRARVEALEDDSWKQAESTRFCVDALVKRIEALEANSKPTPNSSHIGRSLHLTPEQQEEIAALLRPNYPAKPDSALVKRVVAVIADPDGPEELWHDDARAAIREVAAWLSRESEGYLGSGAHWAQRLQREAER
jgi:hypothetical protein